MEMNYGILKVKILLKSNKRSSIVVINNNVYFNNSVGDIIALRTSDGSVLGKCQLRVVMFTKIHLV